MRWGLVPYWAKDIKIGYSTFNARAEGIDTRPAFREPFARRRCLVPLDRFYEWKKLGKDRQPYAVALADRRLMAMAGVWDSWRSPTGERVRSFTIVTTAPNELLAPLHDRMPVILDPASWPLWLGETPADPARLKELLIPYPANDMVIWPVSTRLGNRHFGDDTVGPERIKFTIRRCLVSEKRRNALTFFHPTLAADDRREQKKSSARRSAASSRPS